MQVNLPCFQKGRFIPEIGMNERELVLISTKDLNRKMKDNDVSREDKKRIKQTRRTLLNRYIQRKIANLRPRN